jgi:hypothetical protein
VKGTAAMRRRRLRIGRVLDCFSSLQWEGGCVCVHALDDEEDAAVEREALVASGRRRQQLQDQVLRLRDLVDSTRTLGFHLQPKVLLLPRHEFAVWQYHNSQPSACLLVCFFFLGGLAIHG